MVYRRFVLFIAALALSMVMLVSACSADATPTPTPSVSEADVIALVEGWYVRTTGQLPDLAVYEFVGKWMSETRSWHVSSEKIPAWTWVVPEETLAVKLVLNSR